MSAIPSTDPIRAALAAEAGYPTAVRVAVGTKRGANYGHVYAPDGTLIGRVFRDSKVARTALGGGRRSFWTAVAILDGIESGCSLGTRHEARRDAVNAVLSFARSYPAATIKRAAAIKAPYPLPWDREWSQIKQRALACAVSQYKYDHHAVCGLSVRNLSDPRASRFHIHVQEV